MPNHWLLKTEPSTYSWDDLVREKTAVWDGVSNPVALRNLAAMKPGDDALIYHTGDEKAIVGLARVISDSYDDPNDPRLAVVDLEFERAVATPVTLSAIKADSAFQNLGLVRQGRLSVVPVSLSLWSRLLGMAGES